MHNDSFNNGVAVAIDDAEMDNENENNISGTSLTTAGFNSNVPYNTDFEINNSTVDIEFYISGFTGLMRINRLLFLAEHCPPLRIEALRLGLNYIMERFDTQLYSTTYKQLADAYSKLSAQQQQQLQQIPAFDSNWVEATNKKAALKLEKLDSDLKSAKSMSIKDCIRRGQEDLADHFLEMGDLTNALKCYSRSRDYCSSNKHFVNLCMNVIKVRNNIPICSCFFFFIFYAFFFSR
jgi:COP9 signalosome complex subunit 1